MTETQNRFAQEHARADIAHNPSYFVSHSRLVAMNRAVAAGGLSLLERAVFKSLMCIEQQLAAVGTEISALFMFIVTIPADHDLNGLGLPPHSRVFPHISSERWTEEFID